MGVNPCGLRGTLPWSHVFAVIDAHFKWPEVVMMTSTTSEKTIEALRSMFANHGLPEQMVSDNGPNSLQVCFCSS